ncbi:MAG: tRNA pseudouridine(38-40) synthase TruA [Eubacterium sp.]|nr:tRNA pseudouridine(38-40) synthase TruA [Eubacterium sp.]
MRNFAVTMAYNGAAYHGFQRQDNGVTIQQTVEAAIKKLTGCEVGINGCSRTDAGVHANEFVFSVPIDSRIPCDGFVKGMNALLPTDIAILSCKETDSNFHARYSCKGKQYLYRIYTSEIRDVFSENTALHYPYTLNIPLMNEAAELLVGTHDFAAFCKAESLHLVKTTVRTVTEARVADNGKYTDIYVSGDGFLHNMVRIIAGTLIYISEGKRTAEDITAALETGDRERAGKTAPACGLYLNKVFY